VKKVLVYKLVVTVDPSDPDCASQHSLLEGVKALGGVTSAEVASFKATTAK
jgi:hypothetical protein